MNTISITNQGSDPFLTHNGANYSLEELRNNFEKIQINKSTVEDLVTDFKTLGFTHTESDDDSGSTFNSLGSHSTEHMDRGPSKF